MSKDSAELRDTSVRIFDLFVTQSFSESPSILHDACWTVFAAAASMILASKLHHSQNPIKAVRSLGASHIWNSFAHFQRPFYRLNLTSLRRKTFFSSREWLLCALVAEYPRILPPPFSWRTWCRCAMTLSMARSWLIERMPWLANSWKVWRFCMLWCVC